MTEQQAQKLNEIHSMLTAFKEIYNDQLSGKKVSFSLDPNDNSLCPTKIE